MNAFPTAPLSCPELEPIVRAWALTAEQHRLKSPAGDEEIAEVEAKLGRSLPTAVRALYRFSNGVDLLGGNLRFFPLRSDRLYGSVLSCTDDVREQRPALPDELLLIGNNGSDDHFALWLPRGSDARFPAPVIQIGEFNFDSMAVVGSRVERFLRWWSALYLIDEEPAVEALDVLGVPGDLRLNWARSNATRDALARWADPDLPFPKPDPVDQCLTAEWLRKRYSPK